MENIQQLLAKAEEQVQLDASRQMNSGEGFNIFRIAKIERSEVNTHSAMIAELLDPKGSHGQGTRFLQLMLLKMGVVHDCSLSEASVRKEQSFPYGKGRVDIAIHLRDLLILIENKIDARDGFEQLKNYAQIGEASGKRWELWYLTKTGRDASVDSHGGKAYRQMSYSEHVLDWLEQCVDCSADKPAMQQALIQYRHLVQRITGKTMAHSTREALIALLSTSDDFKAADAIAEALPYAKGAMLFRFFQKVQAELSNKNIVRVTPPNGFAGIEATQENCNRWFMPKGQKLRNVGLFFNIGRTDILFRIEVATEALHFGVVPVKNGDLRLIEHPEDYLQHLPWNLHYRSWKAFHWFSCLHKDYVARDIGYLSDLSEFLSEVWQTLAHLQSDQRDNNILEYDEKHRTLA